MRSREPAILWLLVPRMRGDDGAGEREAGAGMTAEVWASEDGCGDGSTRGQKESRAKALLQKVSRQYAGLIRAFGSQRSSLDVVSV